jgi:hypothetical protein
MSLNIISEIPNDLIVMYVTPRQNFEETWRLHFVSKVADKSLLDETPSGVK